MKKTGGRKSRDKSRQITLKHDYRPLIYEKLFLNMLSISHKIHVIMIVISRFSKRANQTKKIFENKNVP
jgi:hypothetical protein